MKSTWRIFRLLFLLAVLPSAVQAQDDYIFTTNADGVTLTIKVYGGVGGDVTIPSTNNGMQVVNIAARAFEDTGVTSVTIPNGITNIGIWAFYADTDLTNVTIPGSVIAIGDSAFDDCSSLTSVTISNGVTSIGNWSFSDCVSLTSMTIPAGVSSIGDGAFFECESLTNVSIPAGVTSLGVDAFYNCTSLTAVAIPGSVTSIGIQAFESCTSLTNVSMGSGVTSIGEAAFNYCTSLSSVTIPAGVTSIGVEAFQSCGSLVNLTIPGSVTSLGDVAFSDCSSLINVFFKGNAPTLGSAVFLYDTNAKAYYMPGTTGWKSPFGGLPAALTPIYVIKVLGSPPLADATVNGGGSYPRDSNVVVTAATPEGCYGFVGWRVLGKTVSTDLTYSFMPTKSETLVATFGLFLRTISTSSSPTNWGMIIGGGKKHCGTTAFLTAIAKPGFAFTEWTSSLGVTSTNRIYKFTVDGSESFVAHFQDIARPTIRITMPIANERIGTAAFVIKGTAADNAGVAAVYYNLNETGWQTASSSNGYKTWFADVSLPPMSSNTLSAYAQDTSGNVSTTVGPIKFVCTAQGLAPMAIAGQQAEVVSSASAEDYFPVSFGSGTYVKMPANSVDEGEVGDYTYRVTGPNTAELVPHRLLPRKDNDVYGSTLELTFTDPYTAAFTNRSGAGGTFSFAPADESVPATLDGSVAVTASFVNSNSFATNSFGKSTFTTTDSLGRSSSGSYAFTQFTPVAALVTETYSRPSDMMGKTNYMILTFKEGAARSAGVYYSEAVDASGKLTSDIGGFH